MTVPKLMYTRRHKLLALTGVVAAALIMVPAAWRTLEPHWLRAHSDLPTLAAPYSGSSALRKGSLNGIPYSIPSNYLEYPVEYLDTSIWSSHKPKVDYENRTYTDAIQDFAIRVHWPDFKPRTMENNRSYLKERYAPVPTAWFTISVDHGYVDAPRPPKTPDNGMARVLRGKLEELSGEWQSKYPLKVRDPDTGKNVVLKGVHYEMRGLDRGTRLQSAVPVGPGTEAFATSNDSLYWLGDKNGVVETLITCEHGKINIVGVPNAIGSCQHRFDIPEIKAEVTLYYSINWLPHWKEFQDRSRLLILSLRCSPECISKGGINNHGKERKRG